MAAAGVAGASVVFGVDGFGEYDGAFVAQLLDEDVVAGGEVDVVGGVGSAGGAHIFGVEGVFEAEDYAVHWHCLEVWVGAVGGVELGGLLWGVGVVAEVLADGRGGGGQGA